MRTVAKMPYLMLDNVRMHYLMSGEGPPITLLHGAALTLETNWSNQIPVFSRTHRVIAVDLRGHGRTNNPSTALSQAVFATDVINLLEKLQVPQTHLIGFSMGGMTALRIALNAPQLVKSLILCSTGYYVSERSRTLFAQNIDPFTLENLDSEWVEFYRTIHRASGENSWKRLVKQLTESPKHHKLSLPQLATIHAPTLLIVGDRDPYGFTQQAMEMHSAIADSALAILPDTGHMIPTKNAKVFNEMVLRFLAKHKDQHALSSCR
jgi:pimeloyl-ACP methyl ester carboxylesterase